MLNIDPNEVKEAVLDRIKLHDINESKYTSETLLDYINASLKYELNRDILNHDVVIEICKAACKPDKEEKPVKEAKTDKK